MDDVINTYSSGTEFGNKMSSHLVSTPPHIIGSVPPSWLPLYGNREALINILEEVIPCSSSKFDYVFFFNVKLLQTCFVLKWVYSDLAPYVGDVTLEAFDHQISEVTVPTRELLVCFSLIERETIKVDVAGALEEERVIVNWKLWMHSIPACFLCK